MNVLKSSSIYSFFTFLSRIFGYLRDILIANFLGTGIYADIFFVAFRFPNTFRRIFSEGALNTAFVPIYSKIRASKNIHETQNFSGNIIVCFSVITIFLVVLIEIFMPFFIQLLAPGFVQIEEKFVELVFVARIIFPFILLITLTSIYSTILNLHNKFAISASIPIVLNIVLCISTIYAFLFSFSILYFLSIGVIVSGILQLIIVIFAVSYENIKVNLFAKIDFINLKNFFKLFFPAFLSSGILQINILIGTIIVSYQSGAVSFLYYADRIYQLPLALIGIALSIVLLPMISREISVKKYGSANKIVNETLIYSLLLSAPAAIALITIPEIIISVLFERGEFDSKSTLSTAHALRMFGFGLIAFILMKILTPIFFAHENPKPTFYIAVINLLINTVISIILFQKIGFIGVAISTSISAWISVIIMYQFLIRKGYLSVDKKIFKPISVILASCIVLYFYLIFLKLNFLVYFGETLIFKTLFLTITVITSIFLYFFIISFYKPFAYQNLKKALVKNE